MNRFLFVNGSPWLHTKSRKTDFRSVQSCKNRGKTDMVSGLYQVKNKYHDRGFTITNYHGDIKIETLQEIYHRHIYTHAPQKNTLGTPNRPSKQSSSAWDMDFTQYHTRNSKNAWKHHWYKTWQLALTSSIPKMGYQTTSAQWQSYWVPQTHTKIS